ncbi:MAG: hypothetical protein R3264_05850, partial [Anaerolineae bacterium]|nr:hypothetical protein [Anaerolineae bacterium]
GVKSLDLPVDEKPLPSSTLVGPPEPAARAPALLNLVAILLIGLALVGLILTTLGSNLETATASLFSLAVANWPWLALILGVAIFAIGNRQALSTAVDTWRTRRQAMQQAKKIVREHQMADASPLQTSPPTAERPASQPSIPSLPVDSGPWPDDEDSTVVFRVDDPATPQPEIGELAVSGHKPETIGIDPPEKQSMRDDDGIIIPQPSRLTASGVTLIQPLQEVLHLEGDSQHSVQFHREIESLLSEQSTHLVEDWLHLQDSHQINHMLSSGSSTRLLLTGFGSFGGTSLVRGITAKMMLRYAEDQAGQVLVVRLESPRHDSDIYQLFINENFAGLVSHQINKKQLLQIVGNAMRDQANTRGPEIVDPEFNTFFGLSQVFVPGELFFAQKGPALADFVRQTLTVLDPNSDASDIQPVLQRLFGEQTGGDTSRIILIIDRIDQPEPFANLMHSALADHPLLSMIVVSRYEKLKQWPPAVRKSLSAQGFSEHYVRRYWKHDFDITQKLQPIMQIDAQAGDAEQRRYLAMLLDHMAYTARGSMALALRELRSRPDWAEEGEHLVMDVRARYKQNQEVIEHNAHVQKIVQQNWDEILESLFNQTEMADQARIGVYYLLDWIRRNTIFTRDRLEKAAADSLIPIADEPALREEVIGNLLRVLEQHHYLAYQTDRDRYKVVWRTPAPAPETVPMDDPPQRQEAGQRTTIGLVCDNLLAGALIAQIVLTVLEAEHTLLVVDYADQAGHLCQKFDDYWPVYAEDFQSQAPALTVITPDESLSYGDFVRVQKASSPNEQLQYLLAEADAIIIAQTDELAGSLLSAENVASRAFVKGIPAIPVGAAGGATRTLWQEIRPEVSSRYANRLSAEAFAQLNPPDVFVPDVARTAVSLAKAAISGKSGQT